MTRPDPETVIWLDPGKTTGICRWDLDQPLIISALQADFKATGEWLEIILSLSPSPGKIYCGWERYIVTPGSVRHGTPYWSLETIGLVKWLCLKYGATILQPQLSAQMAVATDDRLKKAGWYRPGKPHANDAARHLMRYMIRTSMLPSGLWQKVFPGETQPARVPDEIYSYEAWEHDGQGYGVRVTDGNC